MDAPRLCGSRRAWLTRALGGASAAFLLGAGRAQAELEPGMVEVTLLAMQFQPGELRVRVGTTVRWVNREKRTSHSILFADAPESPRLLPDEHWDRRFDRPGRYPYICGPHPEMKAVIIVD